MLKEASSGDLSKLTIEQLEDSLKRPNLTKNEEERILDELIRRTTDTLVSKTRENSGQQSNPKRQRIVLIYQNLRIEMWVSPDKPRLLPINKQCKRVARP